MGALIVTLALVCAGLGLYFVPFVIALLCRHRHAAAIFVLNLLLGWSCLGWVAALVWSFMDQREA